MGDTNNKKGRSTYLTLKQINAFRMLLKFSDFVHDQGAINDAQFLFDIKKEKETLNEMLKKFNQLEKRILENQKS